MPLGNLIVLGFVLVAMWFLLIRPQQQRQKQHKDTVASLTPGQHIVTIGGLVAEIVEIRGDRLLVKVADGTTMEYMREAVGRALPPEEIVDLDRPDEDEAVDEDEDAE